MSKQSKEEIYRIMQQLNIQQTNKQQLNNLMIIIGFQDDVSFAKSLFAQKIIQIYNQCNCEYQKFLSQDKLTTIPKKSRQFLFAIFRRYHQYRIKTKSSQFLCKQQQKIHNLTGLALPNPNNIEEIVKFQRKMYEMFKHLVPTPNSSKFTPFPIVPQPSLRSFENDYYYPYDKNLNKRQSQFFSDLKKQTSQIYFHRNQSFTERNFSKVNHIEMFNDQAQKQHFDKNLSQKQKLGGKHNKEEMGNIYPYKKIKVDETQNINFAPNNLQLVRRELQVINQSRKIILLNRSQDYSQVNKGDQIPVKQCSNKKISENSDKFTL